MIHLDLVWWLKTLGYLGLFFVIFSESGLLIGAFFPGDSLLFTAGFLASQGFFNLALLILVCVVAAITGDSVGYAFGSRVGRRLYERSESRFFKRKHLAAAEAFYEKHGGKTIILARFLPFVRTFAPIIAGTAKMDYRRFLAYNVVGGLLWGAGVPAGGYALGSVIPDVDRYLIPIILVIVFISVLPSVIHVLNNHRDELRRLFSPARRSDP